MRQYNGEKAIISLTSWKARIGTVSKTLHNLLTVCPGFHIVLVLSEEEFPKKEEELPSDLKLFLDNDLIELLWTYKNTKSFKKVIPTMEKYPEVPVISADDDCLYKINYAEILYQNYLQTKGPTSMVFGFGTGYGVIFSPHCLDGYKDFFTDAVIATSHDDLFYRYVFCKFRRRYFKLNCPSNYVIFHDEVQPVTLVCKARDDLNKPLFNKIFGIDLTRVVL